jgi:hypothetical protein
MLCEQLEGFDWQRGVAAELLQCRVRYELSKSEAPEICVASKNGGGRESQRFYGSLRGIFEAFLQPEVSDIPNVRNRTFARGVAIRAERQSCRRRGPYLASTTDRCWTLRRRWSADQAIDARRTSRKVSFRRQTAASALHPKREPPTRQHHEPPPECSRTSATNGRDACKENESALGGLDGPSRSNLDERQ